jgi:hypothetical protein
MSKHNHVVEKCFLIDIDGSSVYHNSSDESISVYLKCALKLDISFICFIEYGKWWNWV